MRLRIFFILCLLSALASPGEPDTNTVAITIATANLSDNTSQAYDDPGIRILQGLKPDILAIQEFNFREGTTQDLVRRMFGPAYTFTREKGGARLPNGIISRYPITAFGQWTDPYVANRSFAWATIQIPGSKPLHVVSVHLVQSHAERRGPEAHQLLKLIRQNFPENDFVVLCGDFNINSREAEALGELTKWFDDSNQPADQTGNKNTNSNRNRPYDFVLPNPALAKFHAATVLLDQRFPDGLVFDSRLWNPPPPPVTQNDTGHNLQHLPVMKTFHIPARQAN